MLLGADFWGSLWSDFALILAIWGLPVCVLGISPLAQQGLSCRSLWGALCISSERMILRIMLHSNVIHKIASKKKKTNRKNSYKATAHSVLG